MLSWIVRRVVERGYRRANSFDLDGLTRMFASDAIFEFVGDTPFGGERRGPAGVRAWFEQVAREFGRLELTARDVAVAGPPWNMRVIVRFTDRYRLVGGQTLDNQGFQFLRLSWGKVKEDRILVDLDVVRRALAIVSESGADASRPAASAPATTGLATAVTPASPVATAPGASATDRGRRRQGSPSEG